MHTEIDPALRTLVLNFKEARLRNRKRIAWALGAWLIVGIVVGIGTGIPIWLRWIGDEPPTPTWFSEEPIDRDSSGFALGFGLGLSAFFIGFFITMILIDKPTHINCPQCGHGWEGSDPSNPSDDWLTWKHCPGCGLKMIYDTGWHEKA